MRAFRQLLLVGIALAGALPACGSSRARPPALPPMRMPAFALGYNEGWFGADYGSSLTTRFDRARVGRTFDGIRAAGGLIVRLFVFEGRQGFVLRDSPPFVAGVNPEMFDHFAFVLDEARRRGLWIYVTALDGNDVPEESGPKRDHYVALYNDEVGAGAAYRELALGPLVMLLTGHREVIFGLDLVNEIDAPSERGIFKGRDGDMRAYVRDTTAFVKARAPWLRVTASVGWDGAARAIASGQLAGLGLDFYDLHVYADDGLASLRENVCARAAQDRVPIFLGEFGQKTRVTDDALQTRVTRGFIESARGSCFRGALAWRFDAAEKWWAYAREDGTLRPAALELRALGNHAP